MDCGEGGESGSGGWLGFGGLLLWEVGAVSFEEREGCWGGWKSW